MLQNGMDIHALLNKIDKFRKLNLKKMSTKEIQKEILEVLLFDNKADLMMFSKNIKVGTQLYRIRKLKNFDIPNNEMKIVQDAWNPPPENVKRGRLNKPQESLLYACFDIDTAIEETTLMENDSFALMVYEVIDEVKATMIGPDEDFAGFDEDKRVKLRILNSFLREEFSREVGEGNEHLYKVSEIIVKDYFDLPPRVIQDAWCYPSIANKPSINICFRPELAFEKLRLVNTLIVNGYRKLDDGFLIDVKGSLKVSGDRLILNK